MSLEYELLVMFRDLIKSYDTLFNENKKPRNNDIEFVYL